MLLAPCPNRKPELDLEPFPAQHRAREIECVYLAERASHVLRQTALREIGVSVRDGMVHLDGRVASYYQKQLAQEAILQNIREATIRNNLEATY